MEKAETAMMDPETAFLASKEETGNEWELYKENVRPLKRGRNVRLLNHALKSQSDNLLKNSLLHHRRRLIEAIDEYDGDDPLRPWIQCIKWVQEAFPPGGDHSGLVVIYEQCVRAFWHDTRYKDDLRYLKVWLEYAENCIDSEVIYCFLDSNQIGQTHAIFFISYALQMEAKNKIKTANDIFNRGLSRNAQPIEKLKEAYKKFLARSMRSPKATEEDLAENCVPVRSFGTVLAKGENRIQTTGSSDLAKKRLNHNRAQGTSLAIYTDAKSGTSFGHQTELSKAEVKPWHNLGPRAERNKENNAIPTKWTANKIPQKVGHRNGVATAKPSIEVFVDEECLETKKVNSEEQRSSTLRLKNKDIKDLKKETELLRERPLRHFPPSSLPR
ncbi:mitotic spindle checkpoint protein BUBR1 isoform X1 [Apium graveolens]|uniref:mitotic spindle checkpoint protein BUBR1 isoform X1 n=1 Tax=Apium graveolens TaxID=4045 RepID=UPI003D7976DA